MCTHACMCRALLQLADKDPDCQRTYQGSHLIVPHGAQYRILFPEMVMPHNHQGLLIDQNTGEPYPMATAGDFCLVHPLFPGSPGDGLLFKEDDLNRLKTKGFSVSAHCPQGRQTPVSPHQRACTKLLQGRGIMQDQWQELWGIITLGP